MRTWTATKHLDSILTYSHEEIPLGTIGPLRLIENLEDTFLVMNGDILTDLNYRKLIESHKKRGAIATVATYQRDVNIDFGVLERDSDNKIVAFPGKTHIPFRCQHGSVRFLPENSRLCSS